MKRFFTLEYWQDDGWYVGELKEIPGVFSQGETLEELEENIEDAYWMIMADDSLADHPPGRTKEISVEVGRKGEISSGSLWTQAVSSSATARSRISTPIR